GAIMFRRIRRPLSIVMLAVAALTMATCISARERDFVRYDAVKDEFQMLMILQDIRAKSPDDLEYLEAIYKNRDHLIAPAIPGGANLLSAFNFSFIRVSDKSFMDINIFASRPSGLDATTTGVSLESIKVNPGTFFLQDNQLGYYQSIVVP